MDFAGIHPDQINVFILVFVRITAIIVMLPVFGTDFLPIQLKAGFSLLLSILVFPFVMAHLHGPVAFSIPLFVLGIAKEVFVGVAIGFASTVLFAVVQFAGMLIDRQSGMSMVELIDPTTEMEVTFTGQFLFLIFMIVFLVTNCHYFLIIAIQKSFEVIPLLGVHIPSDRLAGFLTDMVGNIFGLAIRLSAPVFVVLFLTSLGLAIVARTVPQINVFFVGLPLQISLAIITTMITLPILTTIFRRAVDLMVQDIWKLLYLMA
jgi:flagellar biosynthesis protein FliR